MDLNGMMAALAATGDALNRAELQVAQLTAANQQLQARVVELEERHPEESVTTPPGDAGLPHGDAETSDRRSTATTTS